PWIGEDRRWVEGARLDRVLLVPEAAHADELELFHLGLRVHKNELELRRRVAGDRSDRAEVPRLLSPDVEAERRQVQRLPRVAEASGCIEHRVRTRIRSKRDRAEIDERRSVERAPDFAVGLR